MAFCGIIISGVILEFINYRYPNHIYDSETTTVCSCMGNCNCTKAKCISPRIYIPLIVFFYCSLGLFIGISGNDAYLSIVIIVINLGLLKNEKLCFFLFC